MLDFLTACIQLDPAAIVKAGGYLGIAIAVFAESGLLFGVVLPGDSLLFAAGLLAASGFLSVLPLIVVIVLAAIAGDSVGYWFGSAVGDSLWKRQDSRLWKREYLERTKHFYDRFGPRAVVLARFIPVIRTVAPMFAGIARMPYRSFFKYNVMGALTWGAGVPLAGFWLGSAFPAVEHYLLPLSLAIIVVSFLPFALKLRRTKKSGGGR